MYYFIVTKGNNLTFNGIITNAITYMQEMSGTLKVDNHTCFNSSHAINVEVGQKFTYGQITNSRFTNISVRTVFLSTLVENSYIVYNIFENVNLAIDIRGVTTKVISNTVF